MGRADRLSVVVVGAGAVGLTLAGRLAQHGVEVSIHEQAPSHARIGSRAICMQRETLEIWHRLGIGERVAERGIQWRVGRTYHRGRLLFEIRLPDQPDEHFPPFVNISQSEVEELLAERVGELGVAVQHRRNFVFANVSTSLVRVLPSNAFRMLDSSNTTAPNAAASNFSSRS